MHHYDLKSGRIPRRYQITSPIQRLLEIIQFRPEQETQNSIIERDSELAATQESR